MFQDMKNYFNFKDRLKQVFKMTLDVESNIGSNPDTKQTQTYELYKTRWVVLCIFVAYSASNGMQWIQFSILTDVVVKYYGVATSVVDWTSMVYMVLYIPFIFPASYLLEKLGLRKAVLIGIIGTCLGSWIKIAAVSQDRFWLAFVGQSVVALMNIFVISIPSSLAATWFGSAEVASACSIGVFGNQLGIALGFILPPMIVDNNATTDDLKTQFYILFGFNAVVTSIILILIILFFKNAPPTPPSPASAQQKDENANFFGSLKNLITDKSYMLLLVAYGINVGVFYAISTLLNQIILHYYPSASADAGRIGLVMVLAGMFGSVGCGYVLDKYHRYKETTLVVYAFSLLGMVAFTFTLSKGLIVVYVISGVLGFFMTGLLPVGFELASELTYPEPEGTSAGLLNAASQLFGIAFTNIYSVIFYNASDSWANIVMCITLVLGTLMLSLTTSNQKRQAAQSEKNKS